MFYYNKFLSIIKSLMTTLPKFLIFTGACVALIFYHFAALDNPRLETLGPGQFRIYSREDITSPLIYNRISIATGFIYVTCSTNAPQLRQKFTHIDGESITLSTPKTARQVLSQLGHHKVEQHISSVMTTTYAHSNRARAFITSGSNRINLQIIERDGVTTVGWPVILMGS